MPDMNIKKTPAHDELLRAAYKLLVDHDGDVGKVKMQDVVSRAGLTSGAFYNVWPGGLPAFQQSLLEFALAAEHIDYLDKLMSQLRGMSPEVAPLSELARRLGAADLAHLKKDPGFRVQVALWARHGSNPAVEEALGASYREMASTYTEVYERVLEAYGRSWRAPFDARSFATLLTALAEGLAMRNAVDPQSVPSDLVADGADESTTWDLFGLTIALLIGATTKPANGNEASAWSQIADLDQ